MSIMWHYGLLLCFCTSLVQAFYEPQLSIHYKHGRYRQVGRVQILYPLSQSLDQLLYSHVIGLLDSQDAREGNIGLGYRVLKERAIVGGYGFYDLRQTPHQHRMHQMTLGAEYLTLNYELRSNIYLPFSASKVIVGQPTFKAHSTRSVVGTQVETPLSGFDVECSYSPTFLPQVQLAVDYYYFAAKGAKAIYGPRVRLNYQISSWLSIEGEWSYDKVRNWNYFIGARLSLALDLKAVSVKSLVSKMVQMPIRDIDVVVQEHCWDNHVEPAFVIATPEELQNIGSGIERMTLDANYLLAADIDLSRLRDRVHVDGTKGFKSIGTRASPFTGRFFGQDHTIKDLFIEDKKEARLLGLFGMTQGTAQKPVLIKDVYLVNVTVIGESKSRIGGLIGKAKQTIIHRASSQGYFESKGIGAHIGGLIGNAQQQSHCYDVHSTARICTVYTLLYVRAGGLIGRMKQSRVEHASSESSIQGGAEASMGGLIGSVYSSYLTDVYSHTNVTQIHGYGSAAGGLVGYMNHSELRQAYSQGRVEVGLLAKVGGLVGQVHNQSFFLNVHSANDLRIRDKAKAGGLIGAMSKSRLEQAYSQSNIKADMKTNIHYAEIGGLVGYIFENENYLYKVCSFSTIKIKGNNVHVGGLVGKMLANNRLEWACSSGVIHVNEGIVGGLIGLIEDQRENKKLSSLCDTYSVCDIKVGAKTIAGGLIGKVCQARLKRAYFSGTLKGSKSATMGAIWGKINPVHTCLKLIYWNEDKLSALRMVHPDFEQQIGAYEAKSAIQMADYRTFPGWFQHDAWSMGTKRPKLTWGPKQQEYEALVLLQYANNLQYFRASFVPLPLELEVLIFTYMRSSGLLDSGQISRLLGYASTSMGPNNLFQGKSRIYWTRDEFINYVLKDQEPTAIKKRAWQIFKKAWSFGKSSKKE